MHTLLTSSMHTESIIHILAYNLLSILSYSKPVAKIILVHTSAPGGSSSSSSAACSTSCIGGIKAGNTYEDVRGRTRTYAYAYDAVEVSTSRRFARQAENSEEEFRLHKIPAPDRGGWIDCRRRCCQPPPCQEWLPSLLRFCGWGCSSPPSRPSSSDRGAALRRPRPPPPSQCTLSSSPRRR